MGRAFEWLYRRLGAGYLVVFAVFDAISAATVCLGTIGMFSLYVDVSKAELLRILVVAEACVFVALLWAGARALGFARPLLAWARGARDEEHARAAWHAAVALPRRMVSGAGWQPFVIVAGPVSVYTTIELDLPTYSAPVLLLGSLVAIAYAAVLAFFAGERLMRPLVEDVGRTLPADFAAAPAGVPLRWKLLGALPLINVITGVVVAGLSESGRASLEDLGIDVIVALLVAFTLSLELTLLVTASVLAPVHDLLDATARVRRGDLGTRVPVVSGDEMGALATSFNSMLRGLEEREALREAFGSYVDPGIVERVLAEGASLEGEEVEATVMFVDIRDFTAFADRASAREAVATLNDFFDLVVPIVLRHRGHANKFVGDGLLAVFGTPERTGDHADCALRAACEIARAVGARYGDRLRIGIGINSGPVVAGSIGGGGRLEFTVIGDPVNVAARVEGLTRASGETILLTEATRCLLAHADVELAPRGSVALRGKGDPVPVYAPQVSTLTASADPVKDRGRGSRSGRERTIF